MAKLIVSDIDGTLVKDGSDQLNIKFYDLITQLKEQDYVFAAASGRQYPSIRKLFDPIAEDMIFIAENGAYVVCRDRVISVTPMNQEKAHELIRDIKQFDGCFATVSQTDYLYVDTREEKFLDLLINGYHNEVKVVDDLNAVDGEIIKVALFCMDGVPREAEAFLKEKWSADFKVANAGKEWLDFMHESVDKGNAIQSIQDALTIAREDTIAFGDNINDVGMMLHAEESYAVRTARKEVKQVAKYITGSYHEDGVLEVLSSFLKS